MTVCNFSPGNLCGSRLTRDVGQKMKTFILIMLFGAWNFGSAYLLLCWYAKSVGKHGRMKVGFMVWLLGFMAGLLLGVPMIFRSIGNASEITSVTLAILTVPGLIAFSVAAIVLFYKKRAGDFRRIDLYLKRLKHGNGA